MNTAVPVVILTSLAAYAFPFLLVHFNRIRKASNAGTWLIVGFVCGGVIGVSLESTPGVEHGRFGGWVWIIAELCPLFYGRSVFLILGSAAGGATMAGLYILMSSVALRRVQILSWIFLISYILAMTANSQSFQRYYDAQILVGIAWAMAFSFRSNSGDERKIVIACIAMSAIQLSLSWYSVYSNIIKI